MAPRKFSPTCNRDLLASGWADDARKNPAEMNVGSAGSVTSTRIFPGVHIGMKQVVAEYLGIENPGYRPGQFSKNPRQGA